MKTAELKIEVKPWAIYNEHEIARVIGEVSPLWVMEHFPEFRLGKKWRAFGFQFAEALQHRVSLHPGRANKSGSLSEIHAPSGLELLEGRPRF
jgi:hypothetical protein